MIAQAMEEVVSLFKDNGIHAVSDPSKVDTPCALILPASYAFDRLGADATGLTCDVYLIVAHKSTDEALKALDALFEKLIAFNDIRSVEAITLPLTQGHYPALKTSLYFTVTKD
ncbi:hypothetical protein [Psychromicrobium sp. YIM B11713]|uniref:hypothetical protein n=1 Tax=Psychromicrobium sp. YIM B11713 TaxID=3145233 RepID=UPI00374F55C9